MSVRGFLGIDAGTQGLSVIFTDESLDVIAVGEGAYEMIPGLEEGCYEQNPDDWSRALRQAMQQLRDRLQREHPAFEVLAIGISGQMHGEVLADREGNAIGSARLWCDSRNEAEEEELTQAFSVKVPKRMTAARWLWTIRNRPEKARKAHSMTTPSGWISYCLTGAWTLGIGDASGMFPVDQSSLDFDQNLLEQFDRKVEDASVRKLSQLLPEIRVAGTDGGTLSDSGAELLGLPAGIPVAPAEGDQPAALAGSLIGEAGMVSCSFGTSVCANSVGDRPFRGVSQAVDHFCAVDGKPINMVWLRNGTTYMNHVVNMFASMLDAPDSFSKVVARAVEAPADCEGLLALPFVDDEPGLGVERGGTAMLIGLNSKNARPGNAVKASLLATMFNLLIGSQVLDEQGFPRTELVLTGGLTRTPELAQVLADVFNTPVTLLQSADEGTAWGAALLASFRHQQMDGTGEDWTGFLNRFKAGADRLSYQPDETVASVHAETFQRYRKLVSIHAKAVECLS